MKRVDSDAESASGAKQQDLEGCDGSREDNERRLVADLIRGDPIAFDRIYRAYRRRVFGYLLRLTSDRAVAEDLLQETWLRLARSATRLRADTNLRGWLFTVATNLHRSQQRKSQADHRRIGGLRQQPEASQQTPLDTLASTQRQRQVERAIARLSPPHRQIILLVGLEQMTPTEAAQILGESPTTARKRLSRARQRLREELKFDD